MAGQHAVVDDPPEQVRVPWDGELEAHGRNALGLAHLTDGRAGVGQRSKLLRAWCPPGSSVV
jgi:hypothetical protein